jgi:hypothetical protein
MGIVVIRVTRAAVEQRVFRGAGAAGPGDRTERGHSARLTGTIHPFEVDGDGKPV